MQEYIPNDILYFQKGTENIESNNEYVSANYNNILIKYKTRKDKDKTIYRFI